MDVSGLQKLTLLDYPGRVACTIFTGGCDLRCPFCHNASLALPERERDVITHDELMAFLKKRVGILDGVAVTGGEPLLYPLDILTRTLHDRGLQIFLETSGTHPFSGRFDWVCLSPKRQQPPLDEAFRRAHELKVIVEREDDLQWAEQNAARVGDDCLLYLQPEWSVYERMMPLLVEYAKAHPQWNISIQTHKFMHIP